MRHVLAAGFLAVAVLPAVADPRDDILSAAARCNAITEYRTWLECYYGAAQPMRAILGLPPAAPSQVKLVPPVGSGPVRPPAMMASAADQDREANQPMASYSFDRQGHFTVTLADGSVWRQNKDDNITARWTAPAASLRASVVPAMFGSHLMRVSDGRSYRVSRAP